MTEDAKTHVLIAGGGVAALEALLALRQLLGDRVKIEIHAPRRDFVYLPLAVAEPFGIGQALRFDLAEIAESHGATYRADGLQSVEPDRHRATMRHRQRIGYDKLLIAYGAKMHWSVPGATTFWGPAGHEGFDGVLKELEEGAAGKVVFTMPAGFGWPLPIYELALMTSAHLAELGVERVELTIVTPEDAPLQLFGPHASDQVATLLATRGIAIKTGRYPIRFADGKLTVAPGDSIPADHVVSMPSYEGRPIDGIPSDPRGFVPVDEHGRVRGLTDVFAAGDATDFPVKQGGLAAQQSDAVAATIAAQLDVDIEAEPFHPTLRGLLLTGSRPRYLRNELGGGQGETSTITDHSLWFPRGKVAGRYLAPLLTSLAGESLEPSKAMLDSSTEIHLEGLDLMRSAVEASLDLTAATAA
ncbi:MAG: NAD(P)/FAD-dependent oxidoreductase [Solirubrobacterales bacterium]